MSHNHDYHDDQNADLNHVFKNYDEFYDTDEDQEVKYPKIDDLLPPNLVMTYEQRVNRLAKIRK